MWCEVKVKVRVMVKVRLGRVRVRVKVRSMLAVQIPHWHTLDVLSGWIGLE